MIYPQSIIGKYRKIRDYGAYTLLFIYFVCSWIRWKRGPGFPEQAIIMDLPNRRAYIFGVEIWPDEAYYLTGILILAALGLFFVTSLFGRIWCGYGCPHSVFVDLFLKVESYFQGDRNARIRLDSQPWTREKRLKKGLTFAVWLLLSFSFAFGWVCYFYDAPQLLYDVIHFQVTAGGLSWLIGLTASTFFFAGYIREKVCTYICPYGRFQSAMLDNDTSVVTYHSWRGEPRSRLSPYNTGLGDCIDCRKCVLVCPMGIDIRDGLQMQCIGCGLCIDACNSVMEKLKRPPYLIAYDSINSTKAKMQKLIPSRKVFQTKTALFASIFVIVSSILLYALATKPKLRLAVLRDRGALFTILPDGSYRNTYTVIVENRTSKSRNVTLMLNALTISSSQSSPKAEREQKAIDFKISNQSDYIKKYNLLLAPGQEIDLEIFAKIGSNEGGVVDAVNFQVIDQSSGTVMVTKARFITR